MHRENSCLHDSNVLRGAYTAAAAYCALNTHTLTFCLLELYSLVGTLIAIIAHIICLHARIHVYVVCTYCWSWRRHLCLVGVLYISIYICIIIMEECSFYSGRLSVGFVFFYFLFSQLYCSVVFFLLCEAQSCLHHKLQHGRWSTAGAKLIETLLQSLWKTGFSE